MSQYDNPWNTFIKKKFNKFDYESFTYICFVLIMSLTAFYIEMRVSKRIRNERNLKNSAVFHVYCIYMFLT